MAATRCGRVRNSPPADRHDGAWPLYVFSIAISNGFNLMEGRAAVASAMARETATTERGPPDHLKTCAQNAHNLRRNGLSTENDLVQRVWSFGMTLPIRVAPIDQRWRCHGCGRCCRGTIISLGTEDRQQLAEQHWEEQPEFSGKRIVARRGLLRRQYHLAKNKDGTCIFLEPDGLCRIHKQYGLEAKPLVCQMFPFQLVPLENFAYVTLRRYCPSAAADDGQPLEEYLDDIRRMAAAGNLAARPAAPPEVVRGQGRSWHFALRTADLLERLMLDQRYPPVRRVVHAINFCDLLDQCRLGRLSREKFASLLSMLEQGAAADAASLFETRRPPRSISGLLFRQIALEYLRLHPRMVVESSWLERWRVIRAAAAFARGKGSLPFLHKCFPQTTFEALEQPLGALAPSVLRPLATYLEAAAASRQYMLLCRYGWSVVEAFRAVALGTAIAMWMLRLGCPDRTPEPQDMIDVVGALDRATGYGPLVGARHRWRVTSLSRLRQIAPLVAWYAR